MTKLIPKKIDGILLLNKQLGITSNRALQQIKRLFGAAKAGHTGSLDPLATGMLPICFGKATKVSQFLLDSDKHYQVEAVLGVKTTTGDAEGAVIVKRAVQEMTLERITSALAQFLGLIEQVPPMFSALKHQGKPLYELARQGIEIERKPRPVTIHSFQHTAYEAEKFSFQVHCSKGTYIRTLVEDIGELLGCGAYVSRLHRSAVSPYGFNNMYSFEELADLQNQQGTEALLSCLLPIDTTVQHLPAVHLSSAAAFLVRAGQSVMVGASAIAVGNQVRIFEHEKQLIGIGEMLADGRIALRRLLI